MDLDGAIFLTLVIACFTLFGGVLAFGSWSETQRVKALHKKTAQK
jgi:hypothetical protein